MSPRAASSYALLTPVASGLLSVVLAGEGFDVTKLVGAGLVLAGLVALQQRRPADAYHQGREPRRRPAVAGD